MMVVEAIRNSIAGSLRRVALVFGAPRRYDQNLSYNLFA